MATQDFKTLLTHMLLKCIERYLATLPLPPPHIFNRFRVQEMLTGKPAVRIGLNPMPGGSHWPHGIIAGWSWFTAKHATVLIRRESYDANWGYYTQDASKLVDGKKKCLGAIS